MSTLLEVVRAPHARSTPEQGQRIPPLVGTLLLCLYLAVANAQTIAPAGAGWPTYGGDPGGLRFSKSSQITRNNLGQLHPVWTFHTHALGTYPASYGTPNFETTPVLSGDTLYFTSPYDVVFALDARTGAERWHFDPKLGELFGDGGMVTSRGVALWPLGAVSESSDCARRVFLATLDARLLAIDASTGHLCSGFGNNGSIDLRSGVHFQGLGYYGMTSPPTVVGNVVVVGSSIIDFKQVDIESGLVRGYDAVNGKLLWSWEPLPWAEKQPVRTGGGNTWGVISADPELGYVYLPTGAASPDYYGGMRPGDDRDANSIVALDAATGKKVWSFQTVHHDLWDYDIAAEPVLFTWRDNTPAVAVTTKMGMIFLLDRRTGQPLVPVEERPVPQSDIPGEKTSPTQPFQNIPTLSPLTMNLSDSSSYQRSPRDADICRKQLASLRYDGIYTPPSLQGSLEYPGPIGGVTWGGAAIDPNTGILYAGTNRLAVAIRQVPRHGVEQVMRRIAPSLMWFASKRKLCIAVLLAAFLIGCVLRRSFNPGWIPIVLFSAGAGLFTWRYMNEVRPGEPTLFRGGYTIYSQFKTPYVMQSQPPVDSRGITCTPAPWGGITAVNLNTLTKVWENPLGSVVPGKHTGVVSFGGPIVTASGLVITAGTQEPWMHVFDSATGRELSQLPLPVPASAIPMTYTLDGRQYIVIAAGGHRDGFSPLGDSLIAFAVK
jgi:quinoprotein glucose dehydrogenase